MAIKGKAKIPRAEARKVVDALFTLWRANIPSFPFGKDAPEEEYDEGIDEGSENTEFEEDEEKIDLYKKLVKYASEGHLFLDENGEVCWDPEGELGGVKKFVKATGRHIALISKKSTKKGPYEQSDEGFVRMVASLCGSSYNKLRDLPNDHAFAIYMIGGILT